MFAGPFAAIDDSSSVLPCARLHNGGLAVPHGDKEPVTISALKLIDLLRANQLLDVMLLSTLMTFAIERGLRTDNPVKGIKKPRGKKLESFLSEDEMARLGEALAWEEETSGNPYPVAAIKLLALTGCRREEIAKLKWSYVDFGRGIIRLPDSKTGEKVVFLSAPGLGLLEELPKAEGNPFVIVGRKEGQPFNGLGKVWERVRARAGLNDVRLHDLRHSFASVGVGDNLSLPIVGALLGHRNPATTQRYAHLSAHPLRSANEAVGSKIAAALNGARETKAF